MYNIVDVVDKILFEDTFLNDIYNQYCDNPDIFELSFNGRIDADRFEQLVSLARKNFKLACLLDPLIANYADAESITDSIFRQLLSFPKKYRNNYAISMAHRQLSYYQLYELNSMHICTEAFAQLIYMQCKYDCFSTEDVIKLLNNSHHISKELLGAFVDSIYLEMGDTPKVSVCKMWASF